MLEKGFSQKLFKALMVVPLVILLIALSMQSSALRLPNASILVASPVPSATTTHSFLFDIATAGTLGSIKFEYCSNSPLIGTVCDAPAGLNADSSVLSSQNGEVGFSIDAANTDNNNIVLTRAATAASTGPVNYSFTDVVNHSTPNTSVFVRIYTYASIDASGAYTDAGVAIFNTAGQVSASGFVPPYVTVCAGLTVAADCSSATGALADFGNLTTSSTAAVSSQFAAATNDPEGYSVYLIGTTLTSGINTIAPLAVAAGSTLGTSQFGLNLRANTNPLIGSNADGIGTAVVNPDYDSPDVFKFEPNDALVSSSLPTEYNRFTTSFIANIDGTEPGGNYASTIIFLGIANF